MLFFKILLPLLGLAELGVAFYPVIKEKNFQGNESFLGGAIFFTNLACSMMYFYAWAWLNGWL